MEIEFLYGPKDGMTVKLQEQETPPTRRTWLITDKIPYHNKPERLYVYDLHKKNTGEFFYMYSGIFNTLGQRVG